MLDVTDLQFSYPSGTFRLQIDALRAAEGEALAVVGPSGSGKTTLLNLVAGILQPDTGSVRVSDTELSTLGANARRLFRLQQIGLVFQSFELLEYLDVLDNILLPARLRGGGIPKELRQRAIELARHMAIDDKLRRPVTQLSQGERQRVAVCRALLFDPPLLLADEPTGNLDPDNKHVVLRLLIDEARRRGSTLVTVTHDHSLLDQFDRVVDFGAFSRGAQA